MTHRPGFFPYEWGLDFLGRHDSLSITGHGGCTSGHRVFRCYASKKSRPCMAPSHTHHPSHFLLTSFSLRTHSQTHSVFGRHRTSFYTPLITQLLHSLRTHSQTHSVFGRLPRSASRNTEAAQPGTACFAHTPQTEPACAKSQSNCLRFAVNYNS